jgi:ABC-type Fe3+ transport system permease subunit
VWRVLLLLLLMMMIVALVAVAAAVACSVYMVSNEQKGSKSSSEKFGSSILNSLVIIGVIAAATFVLVLCYKYRCLKVRPWVGGWVGVRDAIGRCSSERRRFLSAAFHDVGSRIACSALTSPRK